MKVRLAQRESDAGDCEGIYRRHGRPDSGYISNPVRQVYPQYKSPFIETEQNDARIPAPESCPPDRD